MSWAHSDLRFPPHLPLQTNGQVAELNEKGECIFPSKLAILKIFLLSEWNEIASGKTSMLIKWGKKVDPLEFGGMLRCFRVDSVWTNS